MINFILFFLSFGKMKNNKNEIKFNQIKVLTPLVLAGGGPTSYVNR